MSAIPEQLQQVDLSLSPEDIEEFEASLKSEPILKRRRRRITPINRLPVITEEQFSDPEFLAWEETLPQRSRNVDHFFVNIRLHRKYAYMVWRLRGIVPNPTSTQRSEMNEVIRKAIEKLYIELVEEGR